QTNDFAKYSLALAHVAQGVQLGRTHHDHPICHFEGSDGWLVETAAAVDKSGGELALHGAKCGPHVCSGDNLALFRACASYKQLQASRMFDQVRAQGSPVKVRQALGGHGRERQLRFETQECGGVAKRQAQVEQGSSLWLFEL